MIKQILVPTTPEKFDELVDKISIYYGFEDKDQVAAVVSVAIRHLDNDVDTTTTDYLAACVRKNLANGVAYHKHQALNHKHQIEALKNTLVSDPNNTEAMDQLIKASNEGSALAKATIDELEGKALRLV